MKIQPTECCALSLIYGVNNDTPITLMEEMINKYRELRKVNAIRLPKGIGATCFQCVVSPTDQILELNLLNLGFAYVHTFERRTGYPDGLNKLYVLNI